MATTDTPLSVVMPAFGGHFSFCIRKKSGGPDQDRTDDLRNAIAALFQLSYEPTNPRWRNIKLSLPKARTFWGVKAIEGHRRHKRHRIEKRGSQHWIDFTGGNGENGEEVNVHLVASVSSVISCSNKPDQVLLSLLQLYLRKCCFPARIFQNRFGTLICAHLR